MDEQTVINYAKCIKDRIISSERPEIYKGLSLAIDDFLNNARQKNIRSVN